MAVIASNSPLSNMGAFNPTVTALTGTDSLVVTKSNQTLYIRNGTASLVTINILGDGTLIEDLSGQGDPVDNSGGYDVPVAAGAVAAVVLSSIRNFLPGVVAVTGGATDVVAWIHQQ